jgi:hypothetical protein
MKLDLSEVKYNWNDKKIGIKIPTYLTEELAYFLGFHTGDGYMRIKKGKDSRFRVQYDGHHNNDYLWYIQFIKPLIKKVFNKEVSVLKTTNGTVRIAIGSKAIITFLHKSCGLQLSPKKKMGFPEVIKDSNIKLKAVFLRGIADTDFSLVFKKKGHYPVISHQTSDEVLHESIKSLLKELGFKFYSYFRKRETKHCNFETYELEIYGKKNLKKWMETVGFSSYNSISRYLVWIETGHLPPKTNINDRIRILEKRRIKYPPSAPGRN